jgi:2-dehydro-3-deoxygluconokinase
MDIVTLGETMLRISPPDGQRLEQSDQGNFFVGGAESNVAVALARLGKKVAWVSRLPDNPLGRQVANVIRQYGVDVSHVVWAENERLGLYFVEFGSPPRPIRVWYDRANSAASRMTPNDIPLDLIASAKWLHLTGITPALSESCRQTIGAAIDYAHQHGLTVSFDINYRALLWSPDQAAATLGPFCSAADMVMIAARDAQKLFGTSDDAQTAVRDLQGRWGGTIILTRSALGALAYDGKELIDCPGFEATVRDRLGVGDSFDAGVICRLVEGAPLSEALRFGAAVAALKLTIPGDLVLITRREVEEVLTLGGNALHR